MPGCLGDFICYLGQLFHRFFLVSEAMGWVLESAFAGLVEAGTDVGDLLEGVFCPVQLCACSLMVDFLSLEHLTDGLAWKQGARAHAAGFGDVRRPGELELELLDLTSHLDVLFLQLHNLLHVD